MLRTYLRRGFAYCQLFRIKMHYVVVYSISLSVFLFAKAFFEHIDSFHKCAEDISVIWLYVSLPALDA